MTRRVTRIGMMVAALVLAIAAGSDAFAQSAVCADLNARLASLGGGNATYRRFDAAVERQRSELASAQRSAQRGHCRYGVSAACDRVLSTIERMQQNLASLTQQRDRHRSGGSARQQREIEQAIAANRCGERQERAERRSGGGLLSFIFGERGTTSGASVTRYDERGRSVRTLDDLAGTSSSTAPADSGVRNRIRGGTYRTMCVRSCDGYYWPLSFATTRDHFQQDEEICNSMCPGSEVGLYVYPNPGGEPEDMISAETTAPYTALVNAFRFRTEFVDSCACRAPQGILSEAPHSPDAGIALLDATGLRHSVPAPMSRIEPSLDPDTIESIAGGLDLETHGDVIFSGGRSVRVVGPTFSYVQ